MTEYGNLVTPFLIALVLKYSVVFLDLATPIFLPQSTPWLRIATNNEGLIKHILAGLATTTAFACAALCAVHL